MPAAPVIIFLTDYGYADPFVGLCHAVIAGIAPSAGVVDLTHGVQPQDVREGAALLVDCLPWLPAAVVLAVVDPGVGTGRRGVVVEAGKGSGARVFVGPDNGLLVPATEALGGATGAWKLPPTPGDESTFDGRDVFAPAAARIALGEAPGALGVPIDPSSLVPLALPAARRTADGLSAEVVHVDGFGNLQLSARTTLLAEAGLPFGSRTSLHVGASVRPATVCRVFADIPSGGLGIMPDAFGRLQVAVNRGSAARLLGAAVGAPVLIRRPDEAPPGDRP
jgi:S-adenosyl-L-methionine hydrolase (adenosine-forming)